MEASASKIGSSTYASIYQRSKASFGRRDSKESLVLSIRKVRKVREPRLALRAESRYLCPMNLSNARSTVSTVYLRLPKE